VPPSSGRAVPEPTAALIASAIRCGRREVRVAQREFQAGELVELEGDLALDDAAAHDPAAGRHAAHDGLGGTRPP
jgi:hypothetical protein